jgi:hypothetical protein
MAHKAFASDGRLEDRTVEGALCAIVQELARDPAARAA